MNKISWNKIKSKIKSANTHIYQMLKKIEGIESMCFTVLEYPYGRLIADEDFFYFPDTTKKTRQVPFSMVLNKNLEMFMEFNNKSTTYKIYSEGEFLNVSSLFPKSNYHHPSDILQISSGARNAFMLAPIADLKPHKNVEKYFKTEIPKPDSLITHHHTFTMLCEAAKSSWRAQLLVFPKEVVELIQKNQVPEMANYILEFDSKQTSYYENTPFYNFLLTYIKSNDQSISQNTFITDVINQLITIGVGQLPGYSPAMNDKLIPLEFITEIYRDIYKSKYTPIIMIPKHFDLKINLPVYYSILKEEMAFKPSSFSNKPQRCELIYNTFIQCAHHIKELGYFKSTPFYKSATQLELTLFNEKKVNVPANLFKLPKQDIFKFDSRFIEITNKLGYQQNDFPSKTNFLIGCFGIKYNEH